MRFFFFFIIALILLFLSFSAVCYLGLAPKKRRIRILVLSGIVLIDVLTVYFMVAGTSSTDGFIYRSLMFVVTLSFIVNIYGAIIFALSMLVRLILRIIMRVRRRKDRGSAETRQFSKPGGVYAFLKGKAFRLGVLCFTALLAVAGYINMSVVHVYEYEVVSDKLSPGEEYTFAAVSDLHLSTGIYAGGIKDLFEKINETGADAVLFVGDVADNRTSDAAYEELESSLAILNAPHGVFYVNGNHDDSGTRNMAMLMKNAGVTVLINETYRFSDSVTIFGRNDSMRNWNGSKAGLPSAFPEDTFNLVLTHRPTELAFFAAAGGDLSVSGHTHGEQFPLMYPIISASNDAVMGEKEIDGMTAIVSRGVGGWGLHFSLPTPKEISIIRVKGSKD